jgi:23S rRNA (cytidine1920-2'-O)/16S rRNA (cytidine1409-2'-O)-methyltransferase
MAKATKVRLDALLAQRGVFPTRSRAAASVLAGEVRVGDEGRRAEKPGQLVADDVHVSLDEAPEFVSRGGRKLANALDATGVDPAGRHCLDVGASTGGFTDCLLQRGAQRVIAVDVGYGQMHERLRGDERIDLRERTNIRSLDADAIGGAVDLVVADLSFISLRTVAAALLACAAPRADLVLLVKPQFEAGRAEASRGRGVIRDPEVRARVLEEVSGALTELGAAIMGTMESPLKGADGNVEFLLHARKGEH